MLSHRPAVKIAISILLALSLPPAVAAGDPTDAGKVRFTTDVKLAGQVIAKGSYHVQVAASADGPEIVLLKEGTEVVRELAVIEPGRPGKRAKATTRINRTDGRLILQVQVPGQRLLAFFDLAS